MRVRVFYTDGEFDYFSKYNRINAKGIMDEARKEMIQRYGKNAYNYNIECLERINY